ncbi:MULTISPECIES: FtsW/RodA/SpoVE family cell cycle protein [unclassified Granulicatella]|uniref:FtsW/RodA/SpoVE family cell cycle protein n=1 Tax=unclassified Granulicatella TaxID=2630493 RepID=UPI001074805E|nr:MULTISPECIES: putative peptidoglycan glycosyltransferase FtsW [unclassified Granulicatella]MBF0780067.1 cell division protein FtsW [Granulicatella sp. 19428wC4_WM01]TFU95852.1 cell division protein FtsW [Granulicatella sp. WM01]
MKKNEYQYILEISILAIALILSVIGIMSVYSAGSYIAAVVKKDPFYYVQRQTIFVFISLILSVIILKIKYKYFIDYKLIRQISVGMGIVLILMLIFVDPTNGARSWINLGMFSLQPLEFAKIILVWNTAFYFSETRYLDPFPIQNNPTFMQKIWGTYHPEVTLGLVYVGILIPVLLQPDTGGFAIMAATIGLMWLSSGLFEWKKAIKWLIGIVSTGYIGLFLLGNLFGGSDYRIRRILVFLNPFSVSPDDSRQIRNSFFALARGGLTGVGLGNSVQKTGYLPEFHTDFILSIIGEELGIIGIILVLFLLFLLVYLIFKRSMSVKRTFDRYILLGISLIFLIQIFLNVAGVTSLAPLTGVTLPFISYGGSSMLISFMCIGIVLKISLHDKRQHLDDEVSSKRKTEPIKRRRMSLDKQTGGATFENNTKNISR